MNTENKGKESKIDTSIFDRVSKELTTFLNARDSKKIEELDGVVYILNTKELSQIRDFEKSLRLEYSDSVNGKSFLFNHLAKIINPLTPSFYYLPYTKESWEEINCQRAVYEKLEGRFAKYKNKRKNNLKTKLKKEGLPLSVVNKELLKLNDTFEDQRKRLDDILENWDDYEVRISGYDNRKEYPMIMYKYYEDQNSQSKEKRTTTSLRTKVPNILWFENVERKAKNKKISEFFDGAEKIFDQVYIKPVSKGGLKREKINGKLIVTNTKGER